MSDEQVWEAAWTLEDGPLEQESVARALLLALGDLIAIEPARYDLNRRGKWRTYHGAALIVDLLTQRTQLMVIEEERSVEEGGHQVFIGTGKQGLPPQAVARWVEPWPPGPERARQIEAAVERARRELPLCSWVLRTGSPGAQGKVQVQVNGNQWEFSESWWQGEVG